MPPPVGRGAGKLRSNDSATTRHLSSYDLPAGGRRDQRSRGLPSRQGRGTPRASWPRRVRTPSQPSIGPAYARAASGAAGVRRGSCILGSRRPAESWESGRAAGQGLSGRTVGTSAGSDTTPSQPSIGPAYARAASGAAGVPRGSCILGSRRPAESWESGRAAWQGLSCRTVGMSAGSDTTPQEGARPDDARAARSTPAPRRGLSLSTPAGRQSQ